MWSSIGELYPAYVSLLPTPVKQVLVVEPKVSQPVEYKTVQPPQAPYEIKQDEYSRRLWVC